MNARLKALYNRAVMVIILLISIVLTLVAYFLLNGLWQQIVVNIGVTGIATIIIMFVCDISTLSATDKLLQKFQYEIETSNKFSRFGLRDVNHASDNNFKTLINGSRIIDIMCNTGYSFLADYEAELINAFQRNCRIRFLLNNPSSPLVCEKTDAMIRVRHALCPNTTIVDEIQSSTKRINEMINLKKGNRSELRYMRCFPTGSIVIFDKRICVYTPYLPYSHSKRSFSFTFEKNDSDLFDFYQATFDNAFNEGTKPSEQQ